MNTAHEPAFPFVGEHTNLADNARYQANGLTKREYFAAMAMQGIIAGYTNEDKVNGHFIPECEYPLLMMRAVQIADKLLKQLESHE